MHDFLLFGIYGGGHEKRYSDECNYVRAEMSEGLEVVKDQITDEFNSPSIDERYDVDSQSVDLYFSAEGRHFSVRVSEEFDRDYGSGQIRINLRSLGAILRASKEGKAVVRTSGILPN
jgi:hypothetical protein